MASIRSIDITKNSEISVNLSITKEEYGILKQKTEDLLILSADNKTLNKKLTTGKLGNSNRIMLPKKLLNQFEIQELKKKVNSNIFKVNSDIFLLIKLSESNSGIPVFGDEE